MLEPKPKPVRQVLLEWLTHEPYGSTPFEVMVDNLLHELWAQSLVIIDLDPSEMPKSRNALEDFYSVGEPKSNAD